MQNITVWGQEGSSALATREDFSSYSLQVEWGPGRWRDSLIVLPDSRRVSLDQFVASNLRTPRPFHPEYALAIELLIANAVSEAKKRGFRVASVELGVWSYRTITMLGKRVTKTGLPEPITLEDGRTQSRVGYIWVDEDQEGVMLRPWANGDQTIRLVNDGGCYYTPVDDGFGDAVSWKAGSWDKVCRYPALSYVDLAFEWAQIPLLDEGDNMPVTVVCEACHHLLAIEMLRHDRRQGKRICNECAKQLAEAREQAVAQGWDFDAKKPVISKAPVLCAAIPCEHQWGVQLEGPAGQMKKRHVCILCDAPNPDFCND